MIKELKYTVIAPLCQTHQLQNGSNKNLNEQL